MLDLDGVRQWGNMDNHSRRELYQQVIIEHNRHPRNFGKLPQLTHSAEGYNQLCGDHLLVYVHLTEDNTIDGISFEGDGCAISRASASLMTSALKGKTLMEFQLLFDEFHRLVTGKLDPALDTHHLGKLAIFSGIWQYPSRVKCAVLAWHALKGALEHKSSVSTE